MSDPAAAPPAPGTPAPGGNAPDPASAPKTGQTPAPPQAAGKEAPKGEQKTTETVPPAAPQVPEKYDLKLPKDSSLEPGAVEAVASFSKERKLSNEHAQVVLEAVHAHLESQRAELKTRVNGWADDIKGNKEFGGAKLRESMEASKRFMERYAGAEFRKVLDSSGLGNHPGFVEMCVRAGLAMKEDTIVTSGTSASGRDSSEAAMAARLFPSSVKKG